MGTGDLFPDTQKLFLLDGMALFYRAHYALVRSPRFTTAGLCTSGIFGMTGAVLDILNREEPTHIAVAFDTSEPTQRHRIYPDYKSHRPPMPEDMQAQQPYLDRLFQAMQIPVIKMPGYEADDVIATLAVQASAAGFTTLMVTPDKDYHQVVRDDILVYKPGRKGGEVEVLGTAEVLEKWGIERTEQVIDILGLTGDTSDNIPGVPGIGPVTAQKLIKTYGSIENLIANVSELKGKQRQRVEDHADQALLSKQLVTIDLHVPHDLSIDGFKRKKLDTPELKELFAELQFDSLGKRIFGKSFSSASNRAAVIREKRETEIQATLFDEPVVEKTINDVSHSYHVVQTPSERASLVERLLNQSQICFDTETTGLDPRTASPLGISFAIEPHQAYYVVIPEDPKQCHEILDQFRPVFESSSISKIGHNLKYDASLLRWNGIKLGGQLFDTMLAHSMKEPEMRHGLDYLATLYLGYKPIATAELIGPKPKTAKDPPQKNMREVPLDRLAQYACEDADVTLQVAKALLPEISQGDADIVCNQVECPLIPVLVEMEYEGIRLDTAAIEKYSDVLEAEITLLQSKIFEAADREFNVDSPKQLGVVLYDELKLEENPKKTATGQYSTREAELERLASKHPIVADVLDYRNARKLKSTYVDQLPSSVNPKTGHVHTHFNQTWTATGRMQSVNPNLQTIPVRKQRGREIRAAFVPRNDQHLILSADYSQIELRVMAELSGDPGMMAAFAGGEDIHTVTASKVYKVEPIDVTREMRAKAKTVNFGIIYGISAFGLQQRLNIPRAEAADLINNYFEKYPGVQAYIDRTIAFAKKHGYVATQTGRRRYLRDINSRNRGSVQASERLAMNSPIQGTAADMLKLAMIRVYRALNDGGFETKMVLTVHDEIVFDMKASEQADVMPVIEQAMKNTLDMQVPIEVEMGVGQNWLEAH